MSALWQILDPGCIELEIKARRKEEALAKAEAGINNILTIYGQNFGPTQNTGDVVKIGTAGWYASNPFTNGIVLPRVQWGALNIRVGIDKPYVPDAAVGNPNVVIWVIKDGTATNALPLTILPDSCP